MTLHLSETDRTALEHDIDRADRESIDLLCEAYRDAGQHFLHFNRKRKEQRECQSTT